MVGSKKILLFFAKIAIVGVAWFYVGYKIMQFHQSISFYSVKELSPIHYFLLSTVFVLMFLNWLLESYKWKFSLHNILPINILLAYKTVLAGTTFAIISPNRAGEPFGRVSLLAPQFRQAATGAGILCSIAQFTATVLAGFVALPIFLHEKGIITSPITLIVITISLSSIILVIYFNTYRLGVLFSKIPYIKKFTSFITYFESITIKDAGILLVYSLIRYSVFIIQFYFILAVFEIQLNLFQTFTAVGMIYFVTTLIPTTTLAELGVRCSSSVYFIGMYTNNTSHIVLASLLLWIINLSLPAIVGGVVYLNEKRKTQKLN